MRVSSGGHVNFSIRTFHTTSSSPKLTTELVKIHCCRPRFEPTSSYLAMSVPAIKVGLITPSCTSQLTYFLSILEHDYLLRLTLNVNIRNSDYKHFFHYKMTSEPLTFRNSQKMSQKWLYTFIKIKENVY